MTDVEQAVEEAWYRLLIAEEVAERAERAHRRALNAFLRADEAQLEWLTAIAASNRKAEDTAGIDIVRRRELAVSAVQAKRETWLASSERWQAMRRLWEVACGRLLAAEGVGQHTRQRAVAA
jgi:hypothetical protein